VAFETFFASKSNVKNCISCREWGTLSCKIVAEKVQPIMKANTAVDRADNQMLHVLAVPL
jgi:hypothetical protein